MALLLAGGIGRVRINPPQEVSQWIGGHLEIHAPMAKACSEDGHNVIKSPVVII
jgi:hypothetical protein